MNFWQTLPTPFLTLAPMADVTDVAFRQMIMKYSSHKRADGTTGGPDVMWTEFVSADGLMLASAEGRNKLLADLLYTEQERPIVAQLFTRRPANMEKAARLCLQLGFDGVDINMGCPAGVIVEQGCGSAMIKTPELATEIICAAQCGAKSNCGGIPVSIKTRLGYNRDQIEDWLPIILKEHPAALIVHARTRQDMSQVPARWERISQVVELRNELSPETKIIGNGDVLSAEDGRQKALSAGADGAMVGRALFGNPWFFHPIRRLPLCLSALPTHGVDRDTIIHIDTSAAGIEFVSLPERLLALVEHSKLFTELLPHKNFAIMKKHFKAYASGFSGAACLRVRLMEQTNAVAVERVIWDFLAKL